MEEENKEIKSRYKCSVCKVSVIVFDGQIHRPCEHKDAAVTADCEAVATGDCKVSAP